MRRYGLFLFAAALLGLVADAAMPAFAQQGGQPATVPQAEVRLREAEQAAGPPARRLIGPLISLGWAYWRAGREAEALAQIRRAIGLMDAVPQPNRPVLGRMLADAGYMAMQSGRTGEAAQFLDRALPIVEQESQLQTDSYVAGTTYAVLAQLRIQQGRMREAQAFAARAITAREAHVRALAGRDAAPEELAAAYARLARTHAVAGRVQPAIDAGTRAVALADRGGDSVALADALMELGNNLRAANRYAEAEPVLVRAVAMAQRTAGAAAPLSVRALTNLGRLQFETGRLRAAEETFERALALETRARGAESGDAAPVLVRIGQTAASLRRYPEAEQTLLRAIALYQRRFGPNHAGLGVALSNLARVYRFTGRADEAEQVLLRAIAIHERAYGAEHQFVAHSRSDLARVYVAAGRFNDALAVATRARQSMERAGETRGAGLAAMIQSMAYRYTGRLPEAETAAREAVAALRRAQVADAPAIGDALQILGRAVVAQNRPADAVALFREAADVHVRGMGPAYPDAAWSYEGLAGALLAMDRIDEALDAARRATAILRARSAVAAEGRDQDESGERLNYRQVFVTHVRVARAAADRDPAKADELTAEAFGAAQQAQAGGTAAALGRMADRFAAGDDTLGQRLRERGDIQERLNALDRQLAETLASASAGAAAIATRTRGELETARRALVALDRRIARDYPSYRRLISSEGAGLGEVQHALGEDEALLDYLVGIRESYLIVVRRDRAQILTLPVNSARLTREVRALRQGLDPSAVTSIDTLPRYDLARAHALFNAVMAPAMPLLDGINHLFIVPDRALQSLPFNVLVAAPPPEGEGLASYRAAAWLARRFAMSTLPSASALRALRELARPTRAADPFVGFGDPDLRGPPGGTRALNPAQLFLRSGQPNVRALRELSPLPETADELRALAQTLGAPPTAVHLRDRATVREVRRTALSRYRVIAFATHGLTAGELSGVMEPGLIMTPPDQATAEDDGILNASEIATLRLDADWVILSACNTAAADGAPGAEALSGLARAFFYAGSRALLVSHWAVASDAAQKLTTGTFAAIAREPGIGRAEGLRRAMASLIDADQPHMAHPLFWGPFVVVGEGGRSIEVPIEPPAGPPLD